MRVGNPHSGAMRRFGWKCLLVVIACCPVLSQPPPGQDTSKEVPLRIIVVSGAKEAQQVVDQIRQGTDFAVLAKEKSTDATAGAGGYMGRIDPSSLRPELRDALKGLSPGQTTPIIKIPSGYAVVKVLAVASISEMESANRDRLAAVSATSNIRYTPNVSGIGEAESALFRSEKPPGWSQDLRLICESRKQTLANATKRMEEVLSPSNSAALAAQAPLDVTQEYYALGELYAYPGNMDRAIEQYLKGYELAKAMVPAAVPQFEEELGIAYLHKSEMDNDIYNNPGDRCLIPMSAGSAFTQKASSQKAIQYFERYLSAVPDDLAAKWLLNYSYMTVGSYPSGVPPKFLISPSVFESQE